MPNKIVDLVAQNQGREGMHSLVVYFEGVECQQKKKIVFCHWVGSMWESIIS